MSETLLLEHCKTKSDTPACEIRLGEMTVVSLDSVESSQETEFITMTTLSTYELSGGDDEGPAVKASLADLRLLNFKAGATQPFPIKTKIPFYLDVENIGGRDASNVPIGVYLGDQLLGYTHVDTLAVGRGCHLEISIDNPVSGTFEVGMIVNPQKTIQEQNYSNNGVSGQFRWAAPAAVYDLRAYDLCIESDVFAAQDEMGVYLVVMNKGNADCSNFDFVFEIFGAEPYRQVYSVSENLEPGKGLRCDFTLKVKKAGEYTMRLTVDPDRKLPDNDRSNNVCEAAFSVTYDCHFYGAGARWDRPDMIIVLVDAQAYDFLLGSAGNNGIMSEADLASSIGRWNGIGGVNIRSITRSSDLTDEVDNPQYRGTIRIFLYEPGGSKKYDGAVAYAEGISRVPISSPIIRINKSVFPNFYSIFPLLEAQKQAITHEVGHTLGLRHPFTDPKDYIGTGCHDKALMWQFAQPEYVSADLTEHDIYNLKTRYR